MMQRTHHLEESETDSHNGEDRDSNHSCNSDTSDTNCIMTTTNPPNNIDEIEPSALEIDEKWGDKLLRLVVNTKALETLNNYLSSIGGAYSTIGKIEEAKNYALMQQRVAHEMGNVELESKANLFVALYCVVVGWLPLARLILLKEKKMLVDYPSGARQNTFDYVMNLYRNKCQLKLTNM